MGNKTVSFFIQMYHNTTPDTFFYTFLSLHRGSKNVKKIELSGADNERCVAIQISLLRKLTPRIRGFT